MAPVMKVASLEALQVVAAVAVVAAAAVAAMVVVDGDPAGKAAWAVDAKFRNIL